MESKAQDSLVFAHLWLAPVTASIIYGLLVLIKELLHPLRAVPGPLAARFTRLWYLRAVNKGSFEKTNINLHKAYGQPLFANLNLPAATETHYRTNRQDSARSVLV